MSIAQMVFMIRRTPLGRRMRSVLLTLLGAMLLLTGGLTAATATAATASGDATTEADASVLLVLADGTWVWADVDPDSVTDGMALTQAAGNISGVAVAVQESSFGAYVTGIGGVEGPADFSWWWSLWLWNTSAAGWEVASTGASDLSVAAGTALAWSPSHLGEPVADPSHRWPGTSAWSGADIVASTPERLYVSLGGQELYAAPALVDGVAIVATSGIMNWTTMVFETEPSVKAIRLTDGHVMWSTTVDGLGWQNAAPVVTGDLVLVGTTNGTLWALDLANGSLRWDLFTAHRGSGINQEVLVTSVGGVEHAILAAADGVVRAVRLSDGVVTWQQAVTNMTDLAIYYSAPVLHDGQVILGDESGGLHALWAANGSVAWSAELGDRVRSTAAIVDGVAYVATTIHSGVSSSGGHLVAVDLASGNESWRLPLPPSPSSVTVAAGLLVVGSTDGLHFVHPNGTWATNVSGPSVTTTPVLWNGHLLVVNNSAAGGLLRIPADGTGAWVDLGGAVGWNLAPPRVSDCGLVHLTSTGQVRVLGGAACAAPLVVQTVEAPATTAEEEGDAEDGLAAPGLAVLLAGLFVAAVLLRPRD